MNAATSACLPPEPTTVPSGARTSRIRGFWPVRSPYPLCTSVGAIKRCSAFEVTVRSGSSVPLVYEPLPPVWPSFATNGATIASSPRLAPVIVGSGSSAAFARRFPVWVSGATNGVTSAYRGSAVTVLIGSVRACALLSPAPFSVL
jgi:hypothetical protein